VGGINEKIEGWFETCKILGMTGTQGVVIPRRNLDDLMLNDEVLEAVRAKRFHVYAIDRVEEGLEILTGVAAGSPDAKGEYGADTVFGRVQRKLNLFSEEQQPKGKDNE